MSFKIGLFYGSTTCYTEIAAEKIRDFIGADIIELHNIKDVPLAQTVHYDTLIFGISTWDFGELQEDWESHWNDIAEIDLSGKTIALFGMGDQNGYAEWFQDALGMLHQAIEQANPATATQPGVKWIGLWPNQGYDFIASKALTEDQRHFVGLALDEDCQYELSDERIEEWSTQVLTQLADA